MTMDPVVALCLVAGVHPVLDPQVRSDLTRIAEDDAWFTADPGEGQWSRWFWWRRSLGRLLPRGVAWYALAIAEQLPSRTVQRGLRFIAEGWGDFRVHAIHGLDRPVDHLDAFLVDNGTLRSPAADMDNLPYKDRPSRANCPWGPGIVRPAVQLGATWLASLNDEQLAVACDYLLDRQPVGVHRAVGR